MGGLNCQLWVTLKAKLKNSFTSIRFSLDILLGTPSCPYLSTGVLMVVLPSARCMTKEWTFIRTRHGTVNTLIISVGRYYFWAVLVLFFSPFTCWLTTLLSASFMGTVIVLPYLKMCHLGVISQLPPKRNFTKVPIGYKLQVGVMMGDAFY